MSFPKLTLVLITVVLVFFGLNELSAYQNVVDATNNAARFGIQYGVTQEYEPSYCMTAATQTGLLEIDGYKSDAIDCYIPWEWVEDNPQHFFDAAAVHNNLQDHLEKQARLPSIHAAASVGMDSAASFEIVICSKDPGYYYEAASDLCTPQDDPGTEGTQMLVSIHSQYWIGSTLGLHLLPIDIHVIREGIVEYILLAINQGALTTPTPYPLPGCSFSEVARCTP